MSGNQAISAAARSGGSGQDQRPPRVSAATAAAWRRRLRSYEVPPPAADDVTRMRSYEAPPPAADDVTRMRSYEAPPPAADDVTASPPPWPLMAPAAPARGRPADSLPPVRPAADAGTARRTWRRRTAAQGSPVSGYLSVLGLIAILTVQAVLSLRLVWINTAFIDEATYLWAGHLEIAHWLHGASIPPFQTWFSGAPVVYPPVAALADHAGGLAGARMLSLGFMTGATTLLWDLSRRLFGRRAAFFAAALFAVLGPTQFLGALATYDAMALFLMAVSVWCAVAARDRGDSTLLLMAAAAALALANATKYATALFDPVVVMLGALVIPGQRRGKAALGRGGYLAASLAALISALMALGGPPYMAGFMYTTLARTAGDNPPMVVLEYSWRWVGTVVILAWIGVIAGARRRGEAQTAVLAVLAAAGLLAPLEQARIHTITSLHKHVDFGAWLAAPAAGYALARLSRIGRHKKLSLAAAGLLAAGIGPVGALGAAQARELFLTWPDSAPAITQLRGLTRAYPGDYLAEDYDIPAYYLSGSVSWPRWSNTWYLSYPRPGRRRPLTGPAAFQAAIAQHRFSLVILDFLATPGTDGQIVAAMQQAGGYQVVAVVPSSFGQYTIWAHRASRPPEGSHVRG